MFHKDYLSMDSFCTPTDLGRSDNRKNNIFHWYILFLPLLFLFVFTQRYLGTEVELLFNLLYFDVKPYKSILESLAYICNFILFHSSRFNSFLWISDVSCNLYSLFLYRFLFDKVNTFGHHVNNVTILLCPWTSPAFSHGSFLLMLLCSFFADISCH